MAPIIPTISILPELDIGDPKAYGWPRHKFSNPTDDTMKHDGLPRDRGPEPHIESYISDHGCTSLSQGSECCHPTWMPMPVRDSPDERTLCSALYGGRSSRGRGARDRCDQTE